MNLTLIGLIVAGIFILVVGAIVFSLISWALSSLLLPDRRADRSGN